MIDTQELHEKEAEHTSSSIQKPPDPQESSHSETNAASASLEEKLKEAQNQLLRALADLENLRNRNVKEQDSIRKYAVSSFARDMLDVLDNLSRALHTFDNAHDTDKNKTDINALVDGVRLTYTGLQQTFSTYGITEIPTDHAPFNSHVHQAVAEVESNLPPGTIVQCLQRGYSIKGRLLRPAMVNLAKTTTKKPL